MKIRISSSSVEIVQGDITRQETEAIVNAANERLAPGGGVAGAIHKAAGPELWEECKRLGGCRTGEAKITHGYKLPARYVIHTVGPVFRGSRKDDELLKACYRNSLNRALESGIKSISFPAISTGAFGYPMDRAADVALKTSIEFLIRHNYFECIRFVLYNNEALRIHVKKMIEIAGKHSAIEIVKT